MWCNTKLSVSELLSIHVTSLTTFLKIKALYIDTCKTLRTDLNNGKSSGNLWVFVSVICWQNLSFVCVGQSTMFELDNDLTVDEMAYSPNAWLP